MRNFKDLGLVYPARFFHTQRAPRNTLVVVNSDFGLHTAIQEAKSAGLNTVAIHPKHSPFSAGANLAIPVDDIMDVNSVVAAVQRAQRTFLGSEILVHPVYGYHSERTELNKAISSMDGCTMVAPPAELIFQCGDKREARKLIESLGIPIIPGYHGDNTNLSTLIREWESMGRIPLMMKSPGGGGGKGNRKAINAEQIAQARTELGDNVIFESFLTGRNKQVEVQCIVTEEGALFLPPRDCSEMLEHQKKGREIAFRSEILTRLIPGMTRIQQYQKLIGNYLHKAGYRGPVTIEFMVDIDTGRLYFVEMNTRLQVENNTSGIVGGVNILTMQRLIAAKSSIDDYLDAQLHAKKIQSSKNMTRENKLFLLEEQSPHVCAQVRLYAQETKSEWVGDTKQLVKYPLDCHVTSLEIPTHDHGYVETYLKPGMGINSYLVDGMVGIAYGWGDSVESATRHVDEVLGNSHLSIPTNQNISRSWLAQTLKTGYQEVHTGSYPAFLNSHMWDSLSERDSHSEGHYQAGTYVRMV